MSTHDVSLTPTPSPLPPEEYERELRALVRDCAPRLFAVVQEYRRGSEDEDGWVVAWGLVCDDGRTHVTSASGARRFTACTPEAAVSRFRLGAGADVSARLMWIERAA